MDNLNRWVIAKVECDLYREESNGSRCLNQYPLSIKIEHPIAEDFLRELPNGASSALLIINAFQRLIAERREPLDKAERISKKLLCHPSGHEIKKHLPPEDTREELFHLKGDFIHPDPLVRLHARREDGLIRVTTWLASGQTVCSRCCQVISIADTNVKKPCPLCGKKQIFT